MEPDNHTHTPMTPRLVSIDGRYTIELQLRPLSAPEHRDWLGYDIRMIDVTTGARCSLEMADGHQLFLDRVIEPEAPALAVGLRTAIELGTPYVFEPIDERDFRLEVTPEDDRARVRLRFADTASPDEFAWPKGALVTREALLSFASAVERAFAEVQKHYKP
jgi:hypothetical protein